MIQSEDMKRVELKKHNKNSLMNLTYKQQPSTILSSELLSEKFDREEGPSSRNRYQLAPEDNLSYQSTQARIKDLKRGTLCKGQLSSKDESSQSSRLNKPQ